MKEKPNVRIALILAGVVVALSIGLSIYGRRGVNDSYAKVDLGGYTKRMTVAVNVFDANGAPVSRASIESESYSGTSSPGMRNTFPSPLNA